MKNNMGRNDICHCGSGKKYKKCCLEAIAVPIDFAWRKLRQLEGNIMDKHLVPYVMEKISKEVVARAIEDLIPEGLPEEIDQGLFFTNLFLPWLVFNWIPGADFGLEDFFLDESIALQYSRKYASRLDSNQKNFIEIICETHFSFFVVLEVIPGQSLLVKDLLLENEYWVKEKIGTQNINRGDIIFSRVLTLEGQSIFVGMAPYIIPARYHYELIELRFNLIKENKKKKLTSKLLRYEFQYGLFTYFFEIVKDMFKVTMPELRNTDDDPLQLCKSFFTLDILPEAALRKLLPLTLSDNIDDFLSDATVDKTGVVTQIKFPWLRKGNKKHKAWDNTVIGHIKIDKKRLILETNSENRAKKGTKLLEKYLGSSIFFQKMLIESIEPMLKNMPTKNLHPNKETNELQNLPEVQEKIREMMKGYWENWFDEPIPMLDNKTPREAAKTKKGQEQLEALFLLYERSDLDQKDKMLKTNVSYLKTELGLN